VIAATSALITSPDQPAESKAEMLKIADEEAKHLQVLIEDTLEMARLDATNIRVNTEPSNVDEIVRDVVASMRNEIDDRPFKVICDDHPAAIAIDRRLVSLAIKQLLANALKYSPPDTPVTVRVHNGSGVTVEVSDCGKGIPALEQSRIFERLYRSPLVENQIPGSGLGLSIAQNIVRAHQGNLVVVSRPGETTFRLTLPAEQKGGKS
jgi:two-component system, OmpR family, sensor kinase